MNATDYFLRLPSCELEIVAATTTTSAMSPTSLNGSWFKTHYDCTIPEIFFRQRLRINRATINIGKSAVIEAAQDVVGSPYELWDDRIYFLRTLQI